MDKLTRYKKDKHKILQKYLNRELTRLSVWKGFNTQPMISIYEN